jgi:hypothetical protein
MGPDPLDDHQAEDARLESFAQLQLIRLKLSFLLRRVKEHDRVLSHKELHPGVPDIVLLPEPQGLCRASHLLVETANCIGAKHGPCQAWETTSEKPSK